MLNPQFGMQQNYPIQMNLPGQPNFGAGSQMIRLQFDPKVRKFNKEFLNPTIIGLDNVAKVNEMIDQIENLKLLEEEASLKQEHRDLINKQPMAYVLAICIVGCCWLYSINVRQTTIRHRRNEIRHLFRTDTQNICQKYNQMYFSSQGIFVTYRTEILLVPSPETVGQQMHHHHHHHHHLQEQLVVQDPQTNTVMLEDMIEEGILEIFVPFGFQPQQQIQQIQQQQQPLQQVQQQPLQQQQQIIQSNQDSPSYQQQYQQNNQDISPVQQPKLDFNYPAQQFPNVQEQNYQPSQQQQQQYYQDQNQMMKEKLQTNDFQPFDYSKLSDEQLQQLQLKSQLNVN